MRAYSDIQDIQHQMLTCRNPDEAFAILDRFFQNFGFTQLVYSYGVLSNAIGVINDLKLERINMIMSSLNEDEARFYQGDYGQTDLFFDDPAISLFKVGNTKPFLCSLSLAQRGLIESDKRHLSCLENMADATGPARLVFPIRTPETTKLPSGALTAFWGGSDEDFRRRSQEVLQIAPLLVELFVEKTLTHTRSKIVENIRLTKREYECIQYLAAGFRASDIAYRLNRSKSMIDQHLVSARVKIGASTMPQAVAKAVSLGIVSL